MKLSGLSVLAQWLAKDSQKSVPEPGVTRSIGGVRIMRVGNSNANRGVVVLMSSPVENMPESQYRITTADLIAQH
jgi:hypothetical protein